jgi:hypothetical protein
MNELQAALMSHAVDLSAYGNDVARRVARLMAAADRQIMAELTAEVAKIDPSQFKIGRLQTLLLSVRRLNASLYSMVGKRLQADMRELAAYEVEFNVELMRRLVEFPESVAAIAPEKAYAIGTEQPMRGRLMSDWAESLGVRRMERVQDAVAIGFAEGRTTGEIVRTIRGTRAANYADGLMSIDRREAEVMVRTAVAHYAQAAREALYAENADVVGAIVWSSTLDSRTSEFCMLRDGLRYSNDDEHKPLGHAVPWLGGPGRLHWSCRSSCYPELKAAKKLGLSDPGERASQDGPVSGRLTYGRWLERQSEERQREILGATRSKLMREARYRLERFYNNRGRFLTIDELRERDRKTFKELGL